MCLNLFCIHLRIQQKTKQKNQKTETINHCIVYKQRKNARNIGYIEKQQTKILREINKRRDAHKAGKHTDLLYFLIWGLQSNDDSGWNRIQIESAHSRDCKGIDKKKKNRNKHEQKRKHVQAKSKKPVRENTNEKYYNQQL